jgi:hypothetical protein
MDGQFQDFLNPKSMLTPGFAGGLTVLINNALGSALGVPWDYLGYTALGISALFAALVLAAGVPLLQRSIFFILNTLIIFCVAMGSNTTARELRTQATGMLVAPAYADPLKSPVDVLRDVESITGDAVLSDSQKLDQIKKQLDDTQLQLPATPSAQARGTFFKDWGFGQPRSLVPPGLPE